MKRTLLTLLFLFLFAQVAFAQVGTTAKKPPSAPRVKAALDEIGYKYELDSNNDYKLVPIQTEQDGTTADWVFPLPDLLSRLSQVMTLEPGDVVSPGTPAGVGAFRKPQVFLKAGDVVRLEIEGIGSLENPVVSES